MTEYKKNNEGGVWENSYKKTNQHPEIVTGKPTKLE